MLAEEVQHLSVDEVLAIHERLIARFGGSAGVRDPGLLESALYARRPVLLRPGGDGAALFESLLMNHPFVDGNKRVAFFATDVFLRLNGWQLEVEARAAHRFLIGLLEQNSADYEHLLPWIRQSLAPL